MPNGKKKIQKLIAQLEKKVVALKLKVTDLETKKYCPFWGAFVEDSEINTCPYMLQADLTCKDLETSPSKENAWCYKQIEANLTRFELVDQNDLDIIVQDFEKMLEKV